MSDDKLSSPSSDRLPEPPEPDIDALTDRQLLVLVLTRLRRIELNYRLFATWAREIGVVRGADNVVEEVDEYLKSLEGDRPSTA